MLTTCPPTRTNLGSKRPAAEYAPYAIMTAAITEPTAWITDPHLVTRASTRFCNYYVSARMFLMNSGM